MFLEKAFSVDEVGSLMEKGREEKGWSTCVGGKERDEWGQGMMRG